MKSAVILFLFLLLTACAPSEKRVANSAAAPALDTRASKLVKTKESLARFFKPMTVREGDWLDLPYNLPDAAETSNLSQYELLTLLGQRFRRENAADL